MFVLVVIKGITINAVLPNIVNSRKGIDIDSDEFQKLDNIVKSCYKVCICINFFFFK